MRDATKRLGGDSAKINPGVPVDLVIDHSVQVSGIILYSIVALALEPRQIRRNFYLIGLSFLLPNIDLSNLL